MDTSLTICCSPGTYKVIKNDEKYRMQLTQDVVAEQGSSFSKIIFTESESHEGLPKEKRGEEGSQELIFTSNVETNDGGEQMSEKWHDAPTKLMLALMEDLRPKLGKSIHVKTKAKLYKVIAEKIAVEGYAFTPLQIENKFRGLERTYKKTVLNNRQTGRNRQTCAYESELDRILKDKKGINPEYLLESGDVREVSESPVENNCTDTDTSFKDYEPSPSNSFKKKSKFGVREQVLAKMEEIKEERKDFHTKVLDLMKRKDERAEKREERAEKREERSERKLELLERLLNQRKQ